MHVFNIFNLLVDQSMGGLGSIRNPFFTFLDCSDIVLAPTSTLHSQVLTPPKNPYQDCCLFHQQVGLLALGPPPPLLPFFVLFLLLGALFATDLSKTMPFLLQGFSWGEKMGIRFFFGWYVSFVVGCFIKFFWGYLIFYLALTGTFLKLRCVKVWYSLVADHQFLELPFVCSTPLNHLKERKRIKSVHQNRFIL